MTTTGRSNQVFESKEIFTTPDEQLDEILKDLAVNWDSSGNNALILSRVMIINTIKQQRHIDKIEKRNQVYTWVIIVLSIAAVVAQLLPMFYECIGVKCLG